MLLPLSAQATELSVTYIFGAVHCQVFVGAFCVGSRCRGCYDRIVGEILVIWELGLVGVCGHVCALGVEQFATPIQKHQGFLFGSFELTQFDYDVKG